MHVRQCEICGKRAARYVCQGCGREVCEVCLEPHVWICSECYKRLKPEAPVMMTSFSWSMPLKLFFLGVLLTFVGVLFVVIAGLVSGGSAGVIWMLPFPPVILGVGWPYPVWAIVLCVVLAALGVVLFVLLSKSARKTWSI